MKFSVKAILKMIQKQSSGYGVMCLIFLAVCSASPLKQSRLQRQLDKLDIKTRRENLLRREEINGLYTIMERIEERINNTLPNIDKPIDKPMMDDKQAGIVTVDDVRITEIQKEVYYLKRGFMDEKKLTSRFRGQVVQLNHTVSQLMLHTMITNPCNEYPLTPHYYILKWGFTGVFIFLIFALKHGLWVLVRTASVRRF